MLESAESYTPIMYGAAGLVGLASCFMGYRLFKLMIVLVMALAGAATLAWLGFAYGKEPVLWSMGGLIFGLFLGGILALFFYQVGVGVLVSLFISLTLLPWLQEYDVWTQISIIAVASLIGALIATSLTRLMIQLTSAMLGGLLMTHSALYFITGETVHRAVPNGDGYTLNFNLDLYVAGIALAIGLLGFILQRRLTPG